MYHSHANTKWESIDFNTKQQSKRLRTLRKTGICPKTAPGASSVEKRYVCDDLHLSRRRRVVEMYETRSSQSYQGSAV